VTRTVVKANYVRLGAGGRARVQASASYYGHRPDEEGKRGYRPGFGPEAEGLAKEEVRGFLETAEGSYGYRIVLSPGREMGEEELRRWTREVMSGVEAKGGSWVGFVHDDHTDNPHTHVIAVTEGRLDREELAGMRLGGDIKAEELLGRRSEMERDPMREEEGHGLFAQQQRERGIEAGL
jgi:hypothetical protein